MKNETLYNKTVDILKDAYFNDTLEHGNDCACAVGNLIAAAKGVNIIPDNEGRLSRFTWEQGYPKWFYSVIDKGCPPTDGALSEINKTGYTIDDIILIERAFESTKNDNTEDLAMFNGLMAVIDVLDIIHENNDTEQTQVTKKRFNKSLQTV